MRAHKHSMSKTQIESIINYYALPDGLVSSGQPTPEEFAAIRDAGYQVLINLVPDDPDTTIPNERDIVTPLGMTYVHIPVIWSAPQISDAQKFFDAMRAHATQKIFVHCEVNYRASAFLYMYRRKFLGTEETQARQDLHQIWEPYGTWAKFVDEVMAQP